MARRRGLDSQVTETPPTFAEKERGTLPLDLLLNVNTHVGLSTWWVRAWAKLSHRSHLPIWFSRLWGFLSGFGYSFFANL